MYEALILPCCSHHAASWSSRSLKTRSHVVPYGLLEMPAEFRNAAVESATAVALTLGSVLLSMSIPFAHPEAWMARVAFGA